MSVDQGGRLTKRMKKCPFCGGEPLVVESQDGEGYGHVLMGCGTHRCAGYLMMDNRRERDIEEAIIKWNKRHEETN